MQGGDPVGEAPNAECIGGARLRRAVCAFGTNLRPRGLPPPKTYCLKNLSNKTGL